MNLAEKRWFAIQVRPRYEKTAGDILRNKGYEEFVPLYKEKRQWSDRIKIVTVPLFAGYIFCRFNASAHAPIVTTPGVVRIIGSGKELLPIEEGEVEAIQAVIRCGYKAHPHAYTKIGDKVRITEGPLSGIEGVLVGYKNGSRLVLSVNLVQSSIAVEIQSRDVSVVREPSCLAVRSYSMAVGA